MVNHELLRDEGILIIRPEGSLEASDFQKIAQEIDPYIEANGKLHGVMIDAEAFPGWKGSILVGSLNPGLLVRLTLGHDQVAHEERYLGDLRERIREVQQGPDGFLYLLTDSSNGRILRLSLPAQ